MKSDLREPSRCVVVLVGPTAVGKSALAMEIAARLNGDIVTADSRQVYRYMDIGTAKPSKTEQASIRHHMLDLVQPDDTYSAQRFKTEAARVVSLIQASGKIPIIAGGTGFYIRALLDGLSIPHVPPDDALRTSLQHEAEVHGTAVLHERLRKIDPLSADRIHPHNVPRIIRALEIVQTVGAPVPPLSAGSSVPAVYVGLNMDRPQLDRVADRRVVSQVRAGLVEETRRLIAMGYGTGLSSMQGFGYRHMASYLQGDVDLAEAISQYQLATRRYIRRQMTWFRTDTRIIWFESGPRSAQQVLDHIDRERTSGAWMTGASPR